MTINMLVNLLNEIDSHLLGDMNMIYYYLYDNEQAARAAAAAAVAKIRKDWDVHIQPDRHMVSHGLIAPCDTVLLCGGDCVMGFEVTAEGDFSRGGERDYGRARSRSGYAWIEIEW